MSAPDMAIVEVRLRRIRAILTALPLVASGDEGVDRGGVCLELELMAQGEMNKVMAVLGTDVLNRDC